MRAVLFLLFLLSLRWGGIAHAQSASNYIGGYGEMTYKHFDNGDVPRLDIARFVIYLDHAFNSHWMFKSETEIEHVKLERGMGGEIALEQAYLDYHANEQIGWRAGLIVLPIGIVNQTHIPTTFYSVDRPLFDQIVIPTTWREIGTGLYGAFTKSLSYQVYISEGMKTNEITMGGLNGGKQEGTAGNQTSGILAGSNASHPALSAKLDLVPLAGLRVGASAYLERGHTQEFSRAFILSDLDAEYERGPLRIRAEGAFINTGDASDYAGVPREIAGGYAEISYNLLSLFEHAKSELLPFVRYESYSFAQLTFLGPEVLFTTIGWSNHKAFTGGVAFKPLDELILKADYRWTNTDSPLELREFSLGAGYEF